MTLFEKEIGGTNTPGETATEGFRIEASTDQDREISFDFKIGTGAWTTFREDWQYAWDFNITTTHVENEPIPPTGETYGIIATGTNRPRIYVQAFDAATNQRVSSLISVNAGSGTDTGSSITVQHFSQWGQPDRRIVFRWSMDNVNWTDISGGPQRSYWFEVDYSPKLSQIPIEGAEIEMTVTGEFADNGVYLRAPRTPGNSNTSSIRVSPGDTVRLYLTNNHTGLTQQIRTYGQAYTDESYVKDIFNIPQPTGHYRLPSNRMVAMRDAKSNGMTGADLMVWTTAMGIPSTYLTYGLTYPDHDKPDYSLGYNPSYGGCAAYYEDGIYDQYSGQGKWKLPIHNDYGDAEPELGVLPWSEWDGYYMMLNWHLLPNIVATNANSTVKYWTNSQRTNVPKWDTYFIIPLFNNPTVGEMVMTYKDSQHRARCVRDPRPIELPWNTYWEN